jgi:hypothetical protein
MMIIVHQESSLVLDTQNSIKKNVMPKITISSLGLSDTRTMFSLFKTKRLAYEKAQVMFSRYAGK